jgi:regulator of cell morphogenesis and NO signaling
MSRITPASTLAQVAIEHPETLPVFEAHEIDYCCGGAATIEAACAERGGIEPARLVEELERAIEEAAAGGSRASASRDPRELSTPALIARIIAEHHAYIREIAPALDRLSKKVAAVHGPHNENLVKIARRLAILMKTLLEHLDEEETVLFPMLMRAAPGVRADEPIERGLASMFADHAAVGAGLDEIRALADNYTVPAWGCPTYHELFAKLRALEADVHRHVHLENNVLLPRFVARPAGVGRH